MQTRVQEFPNQSLEIKDEKLYCRCCSKPFLLYRKAIVRQHIKTPTHLSKLRKFLEQETKSAGTVSELCEFEQEHNLQGMKSVPVESKLYRQQVCEVLLESQIPLSKLEYPAFRNLLQQGREDLGGRQAVSELIDFSQKREEKRIKKEIFDKEVGVIFDGAMRLTESLVFLLRYVTEDEKSCWKICQNVAVLHLVGESIDGKQLAMIATDKLIKHYQISPFKLLSLMRDGCPVNDTTVRNLKVTCLLADDITCCSHLLNRVLEAIDTPLILRFTNKWSLLC
jgi:hypothetical protein